MTHGLKALALLNFHQILVFSKGLPQENPDLSQVAGIAMEQERRLRELDGLRNRGSVLEAEIIATNPQSGNLPPRHFYWLYYAIAGFALGGIGAMTRLQKKVLLRRRRRCDHQIRSEGITSGTLHAIKAFAIFLGEHLDSSAINAMKQTTIICWSFSELTPNAAIPDPIQTVLEDMTGVRHPGTEVVPVRDLSPATRWSKLLRLHRPELLRCAGPKRASWH